MKKRIDLAPDKMMDTESTESASTSSHQSEEKKSKQERGARFRYGNYNRYYGMRTKGFDRDPRLDLLPVEWFKGRAVLDIGCNVGYLTLALAKNFQPAHILGIDIDENLIGVARKNIRHYCDESVEIKGKYPASYTANLHRRDKEFSTTGRIRFDEDGGDRGKGDEAENAQASNAAAQKPSAFPDNVWFLRENYVLEVDEDLEMVREEYDVILALSITKWIHLNWGDEGLKRFFRRSYRHLRPGGRLVLEIQALETYAKKSKVAEETRQNFLRMSFKPEEFTEYLLSPEVGFESFEELGVPRAASKGFERPLLCFKKAIYKAQIVDKGERITLKAKRTMPQRHPEPEVIMEESNMGET